MIRRVVIPATFLLLLVPVVEAAWPEDINDDLNAWEQIDDRDAREQELQDQDDEFHTSSELFPIVSGEASSTSSQSDVVVVTVGGKTIVLSDVPTNQWFAPYVREIASRGIVSGYRTPEGEPTGLFGPADNVTIEQLAKVLVIAPGHIASCDGQSENTTAQGTWSDSYVGCAEILGWSVYADATVNVLRPATRAEVVVSLLQAYDVSPEERTGNAFSDVTLSTQFGGFIEQAQRDGVVSGYAEADGTPTGKFGPQDAVTRAEFAKIVTLGMQVYGPSN